MTREKLTDAAETLQDAADAATDDDVCERLENQSDAFAELAEAARGPDHGTLARHEHILTEVAADADSDVTTHVEDALESIRAFRETVEGV